MQFTTLAGQRTRWSILSIALLALSLSDVAGAHENSFDALTHDHTECQPYYHAPSAAKLSSFPHIWKTAFILPNDTVAQDKWKSISASVPNIPPKGTEAGDFSKSRTTYPADDPDCWWTYHQCVTPKKSGLPVDVSDVSEPSTLGYGFDDGPNCSHNAFYDYLVSQNQKATMFYIGSNILDWPLEAQRAVSDGHEVCVHTWSHKYMTGLSSEAAFAELYYSMQAMKLVGGVTPTCWRPPYGDVDDRIRAIAHGLGLRLILWQYDSDDWKAGLHGVTPADVDRNYETLIESARNGTFSKSGAILLAHELNNYTMSEAVKYYPKLQAVFKYIAPVGVTMNKTQPYAEANYTMPTFEQYIGGNSSTKSNASSSSAQTSSHTTSGARKGATGDALLGMIAGTVVAALVGVIC